MGVFIASIAARRQGSPAFFGLGGERVDFEDPQAGRKGETLGKGIRSRPEPSDLPNARFHCGKSSTCAPRIEIAAASENMRPSSRTGLAARRPAQLVIFHGAELRCRL